MLGVPSGDDATGGGTTVMGLGAVIVSMLGVEAPAASLPERALRFAMVGFVLVTLEAVREAGFTSSSLPQDDATLERVLFWVYFYVRGTLSCEDAGYSSWWWCGRTVTAEVGNKAGADGGMSEATVDS
jgi:hypothetical protein